MTKEATIQDRVEALGPWFHNMDLNGVQTAPEHFLGDYPAFKWRKLEPWIPKDLTGKTVLDIGCNGGFFSIEMKKRGADRVLGIDFDERYLEQARFAASVYGMEIDFRRMSVYDIPELREKFDLVLFMGVLYHLRYPLLVLDLLSEHAVKDQMVFQSLMRGSNGTLRLKEDYPFAEEEIFNAPEYPKMHFVERSYSGDQTNWWIPNRACSEAMLRSAGFEVIGRPDGDVLMCRKAGAPAEESPRG